LVAVPEGGKIKNGQGCNPDLFTLNTGLCCFWQPQPFLLPEVGQKGIIMITTPMSIFNTTFKLSQQEVELLFRQTPSTKSGGGFQNFLVSLQEKIDPASGWIRLSPQLILRIRRYISCFGQGGWQSLLSRIFSRVLNQITPTPANAPDHQLAA